MATQFTTIYDVALSKMYEYHFAEMESSEIYDLMHMYLMSAQNDFANICVESLESSADGQYDDDLSSESIEILALGIVCHWTTAYVADSDKLRNALGTKDYSVFSPANMLTSVRNMRDAFLLEYHDKINRYSFMHSVLIRPEVSGVR